jgi:hypothetical protein
MIILLLFGIAIDSLVANDAHIRKEIALKKDRILLGTKKSEKEQFFDLIIDIARLMIPIFCVMTIQRLLRIFHLYKWNAQLFGDKFREIGENMVVLSFKHLIPPYFLYYALFVQNGTERTEFIYFFCLYLLYILIS